MWYSRLKPSSISLFDLLTKEFELNFLASDRLRPTIASLLGLTQGSESPSPNSLRRPLLDDHRRPARDSLPLLKGPIEKQIDVIIDEPTSRADNSSTRKAYVRSMVEKRLRHNRDPEITFGAGNEEYPGHDDALKLGLTDKDLVSMTSALIGFTGRGEELALYNVIPLEAERGPTNYQKIGDAKPVYLPSRGHPSVKKDTLACLLLSIKIDERLHTDTLRRTEAHLLAFIYKKATTKLYNRRVLPRQILIGDLVSRKTEVNDMTRVGKKFSSLIELILGVAQLQRLSSVRRFFKLSLIVLNERLGLRRPLLGHDNRVRTQAGFQLLDLLVKPISLIVHGADDPTNVVHSVDQGHVIVLALQR
ncbi:hypothetical protein B296_00057700 [Ensete ventricosum]|uniref:Uncharacterized protein n=1 Tax=Ensete ventricosum TaxID=4639 RepID=A0A426XQ66_ENSVE|nr:hypothetical protein B296_00057700 [Ensete ventricosum]